MKENSYPGSSYQKLFDYLYEEHGLTLLESEMNDLINVVHKFHPSGAALPAADAVQNWFEENIDKDCGASSAIYKFRVWLESLQVTRQPGLGWVKGAPKERKQYFAKVHSKIDDNLFHDAIIWPTQRAGHWYAAGNGFNFVVHDNEVIAYLYESATPANVLPTFWDVAKAFKWAAEHKTEKGESLMLADGWCLIHEGGVTEELTPGNVAELYCLQNGFTKEKDEQPAAAWEEDAVEFAEWAIRNATVTSAYDNWIHSSKKYTTAQLYELFKQQKK